MYIYLYENHPDHNLDGENYPHFRNSTDKLIYIKKKLINNFAKPLKVSLTRISFDTARVSLNLTKNNITKHPSTLSGLLHNSKKYNDFEFWFVVGWSFGSNKSVVILELQLDYWLTYWPLSFNNALVRVNRKHMNRFYKSSTKKNSFLRFNSSNRQLQIPEKTSPTAIYNANFAKIKYPATLSLNKMVAIVVSPTAGFSPYSWPQLWKWKSNFYYPELGDNRPKKQNGFVIFCQANNPNFNSWLSLPGITHCFYFTMDAYDIEVVDYNHTFIPKPYAIHAHEGDYYVQGKHLPNFKKKLICASTTENLFETSYLNYKKILFVIADLTYLSGQYLNHFSHLKIKMLQLITTTVNWIFYGKPSEITKSNLQYQFVIFSLKSLFPKNTLGVPENHNNYVAIPRRYSKMYFTTIDIFNEYMSHSKKNKKYNFVIDVLWDRYFTKDKFKKNETFNIFRKLKMWSNFKYYIGLQNKNQEIYPHLDFIRYNFYWFVTIQNSYFCMEPDYDTFLIPFNKKYNFIARNETKFTNYTDNSLQFYQKQGFQFDTGINQAKFQLDWTQRYNQFAQNKFYYDATVGAMTSIFNRTSAVGGFGGKFGNVPMKAGIGIGAGIGAIEAGTNIYFGYQSMKLQNEMREKQSFYSLKMLLSKQEDIFNNPATTHNVTDTEFSYQLISDKIMPYIFCLIPSSADLEAQALLYHKYGNLNDQAEIVNLNSPWSRRCWNFWEIHNIEQAIIKDNLNHMVITFFNNLFNKGVRLWNVFNEEVVFNDYSLENWESKILEDEK